MYGTMLTDIVASAWPIIWANVRRNDLVLGQHPNIPGVINMPLFPNILWEAYKSLYPQDRICISLKVSPPPLAYASLTIFAPHCGVSIFKSAVEQNRC